MNVPTATKPPGKKPGSHPTLVLKFRGSVQPSNRCPSRGREAIKDFEKLHRSRDTFLNTMKSIQSYDPQLWIECCYYTPFDRSA